MKKSEELLRMERDLNEQPELKEKLKAECKRIAEAGEAQCDGDVMVQAAAALGYTITLGELERLTAEMEELDPETLREVAGGIKNPTENCPESDNFQCFSDYHSPHEDEYGHNAECFAAWHCYTVTLHTETKEEDVSCWKDYKCLIVYDSVFLK